MKHIIQSRLFIFLSAFLLILFVLCSYPSAEEKSVKPVKANQATAEKAKTQDKDTVKAKNDIEKHIVESETGVYYIIQEGDTLWDLSRQFSDSPWVWPDLWEENKQITNPHLIYPGEKIRLYRKKDSDKFGEKVEEKKPEVKRIVKVTPKKEKERPYYFYSPIDSIGFIKKKEITPSGFIFKVKEDKKMVSFGDLVYVRPQHKGSLKLGKKYTMYKTVTPIKGTKTNKYPGIQYYLTGVIEITKIEDKFCVAKVIQSFRNIAPGDLLMPYKRRDPKIYLTESKKGLKGKVIVSEERQEYFGDDNVAFINKGKRDGVKIGQFYTVYYQSEEKISPDSGLFSLSKKTKLTPVDFAKILVLHTEESTSTVLVTQSDITVYPDAIFRAVEP